jgi:hypothetical protein
MRRRPVPAELCFLESSPRAISVLPVALSNGDQAIECLIRFAGRAAVRDLRRNSVFQIGRGGAYVGKTVDASGSRQAVRKVPDATKRVRRTSAFPDRETVLTEHRDISLDTLQECRSQPIE